MSIYISVYDATLFPTGSIKDDEEEENKYHI
jgi:hypothetical protein